MYLFTRQAQLGLGQQAKALEWALGITEKVNQITSLDVGLWTPILSPGLGTLSWGCTAESLGDLEDADAKLMADPIFLDIQQKGAEFLLGPADDTVAQFISNPDSDPNATYVSVVQSQMANGHFARGIEVGVEIAERATKIGGQPTAFLLSTTGTYGGCAWISATTSIRALEAAEQAVNADPKFIAYIDKEAKDCYVEGVTTQSIWRQVA